MTTPPPPPTRAEQLASLAATLRRVRWFSIAFATVQFVIYRPPPDVSVPHPVRPWGVAVCLWLLATNEVSKRLVREGDVRRNERVAALEVVADAALVLFLVALLAFDHVGAEWGLLNIVVLQAALRVGLRGALACWAGTALVYAGIQVWAEDRYGVLNRWNVVTFRLGMVLTVAVIGGGLARQLQRHLEATRRASDEAEERARLLRIAADAGRSLASLGGGEVLDAVMAASIELGFEAADVCVLDEPNGVWRLERAVNLPAGYVEGDQAADVGLSALVRREGRTIVIDDYLGWEGGLEEIRRAGFTTVVGVPVRVGGEVVATLGVGTRRHRPVSAAELECLELLAAQTSAALDAAGRQSYAQDLHALLEHSASHDRLTGLYNRNQLLERLGVAISPGQDEADSAAVVVCDLDGFKTVNDSLGHQAGDQLLRAVAERLAATAGDRLVARLGGDEFAVMVERGGIEAAARLARMLLVDLREPVVVEGTSLAVSVSVGAAAAGQTPTTDPASLLRDAGLALERAKQGGRGRYELFDPSLRLQAQRRLANETDLRVAIQDGSLTVAYQPIVDLETGSVVGVEALARWTHPTRGAVAPTEFIPLAEEAGLIDDLGERVLELACTQARAWHQVVGTAFRLSVNLSAVQLAGERCVGSVAGVLQRTGLDPASLTLEITESAVMEDVPEVLRSVQALAELGVRLAIDDLGRGWSSLAYLTRYPLSELKIDRSFVQGVARRPADRAVIRALVGLAHDLGLRVVAEGIEDGDQLAELTRLGCDAGQGFHLHRPAPASMITEILAGGASLRAG
ncbi:MAG TPA: bifunctional diguanylate cyclase/phosphodiesterase [Acidimicrobiales bacterium]|nr:bifunctional diguanylate cyclase/phosphodiesterase [Acidimicrobiales bacterium]